MGRDMERISVTLTPTQKERLDELWGDGTEFENRSTVIRYLIEQYDTDPEQGESREDDPAREQSASHPVTFNAQHVIPDDAGLLSQLKWRFFGIPASAYAEAINELQAGVSEGELGPPPIEVEASLPSVEETDDDTEITSE